MLYTGGCYCGAIKYEIDLASADEARTSLCHCRNCKVRTEIPTYRRSLFEGLIG